MGTTDKRTFWAYFFQALAGAEAGLNPNASVRHPEPDGAIVPRSEGLLQLAYADHKRYGCDFNWAVDRALKANDPAKTILVDVAARRTELPFIRQANGKSPYFANRGPDDCGANSSSPSVPCSAACGTHDNSCAALPGNACRCALRGRSSNGNRGGRDRRLGPGRWLKLWLRPQVGLAQQCSSQE
jgi:hypothetical protein